MSTMRIKIYQVNLDRDTYGTAFDGYDLVKDKFDESVYDTVYSAEVEADDLEDIYRIFNIDRPNDYRARSLSVSDVVEVLESEEVKTGFYYCDSIGFKKIEFDSNLTENKEVVKMMKVVMCEPGKKAYVAEIGTKLEDLQAAVGGYIETYYPFDSEECIVCNEEGKLNGMVPSRGIYDEDGELIDIVFGPFFICDCSGEDFDSLSEEKQQEYLEKFNLPERFYRTANKEIVGVKYEP